MVGWHHRLNGHEYEQALGDSDGQGGLVYYSPRGCKGSDTTEQVILTELKLKKNITMIFNTNGTEKTV